MVLPIAEPAFRYGACICNSHPHACCAGWLHRSPRPRRLPARLVGLRAAGIIPRRLEPFFRHRDERANAIDLGPRAHVALSHPANFMLVCLQACAASTVPARSTRHCG